MDSAPETLRDPSLTHEERRASVRQILDRFEQAWQDGRSPEIDDYLPFHPDLRMAVLTELVQVDLERRLKAGEASRSEDYLARFPELANDSQFVVDLVSSEYDVRSRREADLTIREFLDRFPAHADELTRIHPAPLVDAAESLSPNHASSKPNSAAKTISFSPTTSADFTAASGVRLRCPDCQATITLHSSPSGELRCPSCAGLFRVESEAGEGARSEALTQVGKFQLLERIGRGAFGAVYRALDVDLDRIVAVKIPRSGAFSSAEEEDRFVREARSVARLSHPAIVPVFEVGRTDSFPYIVCEFVEGVTLARALAHRRFEFREAAELAALIADALDHAHQGGVIHRDLKPSNIMVKPRPRGGAPAGDAGRVRLMDFGLARREDGEATVTVQGQILGTPAYMSPEQARGEAHRVDGRADVYSLGVMLYEMLVGEPPFRGNVRMLLHQVLHDDPRPLRRLNDRIPRDLETICLKCLEKRPERRYATAGELAADLRRWLNNEPILARPLGWVERGIRWVQARPVITALLTFIVLGTIAAFTFIARQWQQTEAARKTQLDLRVHAEVAHRKEGEARLRAEKTGQDLERALRREQAALQKVDKARREVEDRLQRVSQAHRLATASESERGERPIRSLLLAVEALRLTHRKGERRVLEAEQSLRDALATPGADAPTGFEGPFAALTPVDQGRWLITHPDEQTIACHDLHSTSPGAEARELTDPGGLQTALVSADGAWLAALTGRQEVRFARLAANEGGRLVPLETADFPAVPAAMESGFWVAAFSPDGRWFAAAGQDRQVRVWDLHSPQTDPVVFSGHALSVRQVLFSPDSRRLLTASYDRSARIYRLPGGDASEPTEPLVLTIGKAPEAFFAPLGRWLVTTNQESAAALWDLDGPEPDSPLITRRLGRFVMPSPDGKWMIIHAEPERPSFFSRLWIWRMPDATADAASVIAPPIRLGDRISSAIEVSPDGRWLAAIPSDGSTRIWNLHADDPTEGFHDFPGADSICLSFSAESNMLAAGGQSGAVRIWRADDAGWPSNFQTFSGGGAVTTVRIDERQRRIVAGDRKGDIRIWPLDEAAAIDWPVTIRRHETAIHSLSLATDNRWLVSTSEEGDSRLWDLSRLDARMSPYRPAGQPIAGPSRRGTSTGEPSFLLAPAAGGRLLHIVDRQLRLWTLAEPARSHPIHTIDAGDFTPACADVSADGSWLASADREGELRIWRLDSNKALASGAALALQMKSPASEGAQEGGNATVAFNSHGDMLAHLQVDGRLGAWRLSGGSWRPVEFESPLPARDVWFASGGQGTASDRWLIATIGAAIPTDASASRLALWDMAAPDGRARQVPLGATIERQPTAIAISPDGRWLAVADWLGAVRLWDLATAAGVGDQTTPPPRSFLLPVGATSVRTMTFSRDSGALAAAGETRASLTHEARVWTLSDDGLATEPTILPGHSSAIGAIAFSPDGRKLITGGDDGAMGIWDLDDAPSAWLGHPAPASHGLEARATAPSAQAGDGPLPTFLRGDESAISALAVTDDGRRAASATADGAVRLWSLEIAAQPPIVLATDHQAAALAIAGGDRFLVGEGANGVQLWRLNVDDLLALAQRIAGRELTDEERRQYLLIATPGIH